MTLRCLFTADDFLSFLEEFLRHDGGMRFVKDYHVLFIMTTYSSSTVTPDILGARENPSFFNSPNQRPGIDLVPYNREQTTVGPSICLIYVENALRPRLSGHLELRTRSGNSSSV